MAGSPRERLRIEVEGLHCVRCADALREAVGQLPAVELVRVEVEKGCLVAEIDPAKTPRERLLADLRDAGFPPRWVERVEPAAEAPAEEPRGRSGSYLLFALLVLGLAVAGYAGYALYPRFELPAVEGAALLLLAAGAGIASFFSPCAFGLLATLLAREAGERGPRREIGGALSFATGLSVGAAAFVLAVGLIVGLGGAGLVSGVTFTSTAGRSLRLVVGGLLVLLGLVQLNLLPNPLHRVEAWVRPLQRLSARQRRRRPLWGYVLFGFGYLLAGFG